jgi:hypothetical protein
MCRVGKAIVYEPVEQHRITHLVTASHLRGQERRASHTFRTAGDVEMAITCDAAMDRAHNSLHLAAASPVDGLCRHIDRQA